MEHTNCPFCFTGIENACFAESANFRAIYNRAPVLPGHILIIPKKHIQGFLGIDEEQLTEMVSFSRKVIRTLCEIFKTDSFDWTLQDGKPAGQTIDHMHIHIIPRHEGDLPEPGDWYPQLVSKMPEIIDSVSRPKLKDDEMKIIISHLKDSFTRYS